MSKTPPSLIRHRTLPRAEIVHFYDGNRCIWSRHNEVVVEGRTRSYRLQLPTVPADWIGGWSRLVRRGLRLDKCNVVPGDSALESLVIVRQGQVYHYDSVSESLTRTLQLRNCRNVLHQSIARHDHELFLAEYGSNDARESVPVYKSGDGGRHWQIVHEFGPGKIKHAHGCFFDPYEDRVWVLTGDFEGECFMLRADRDFEDLELLGDGSQAWRACNIFFGADDIHWMMDSQLETSFVMRLPRGQDTPERIRALPGPAWYAKELTDDVYLGGTTCEIGPGVHDEFAHLYASSSLDYWQECARFAHDRLPKRYLKFGVLGFADGAQSSDDFAMFGEALRGLDGKVGIFGLSQNLVGRTNALADGGDQIYRHLIQIYDLTGAQVDNWPDEIVQVDGKKPSFRRAPLSLLRAMVVGCDQSGGHGNTARDWRNALLRFTEFQTYRLDRQFRQVHPRQAELSALLLAGTLVSSFLNYMDPRYLNAALKVRDSRSFQTLRHASMNNASGNANLTVAATELTCALEFALSRLPMS